MSKHYISCARCDKDIIIKTSNDCYSSEIDGQLLCYDCWQKEQPKYLAEQIADLEAKLAESEKRIQAYEEIVEQKDEEIGFANRDKTCIVKQLNDPKAYVLLEDYKELKQQLAEKETRIAELEDKDWYEGTIKQLEEQNERLIKQLAEKEKEIESLRENSLSKRIFKEKLIPSHCMEQYEKYEQEIDKLTQDKISFALEQLEKVKRHIIEDTVWELTYEDAIKIIDNQIEELKKEMK